MPFKQLFRCDQDRVPADTDKRGPVDGPGRISCCPEPGLLPPPQPQVFSAKHVLSAKKGHSDKRCGLKQNPR